MPHARATKALRTFRPGLRFALHWLAVRDGGNGSAVARAKPLGAAGDQARESLIVKLLPATPEGRAKLTREFARQSVASAAMNGTDLRVPRPMWLGDTLAAAIYEDAGGKTLSQLWAGLATPADGAPLLHAAGRWLRAYHTLSARAAPFSPAPHLNWLLKGVAAHRAGQRTIPEFTRLEAQIPALHALAKASHGQPNTRAITHRDFHLRNLIQRRSGQTFGFDFENDAEDEALRDSAFLLNDALIHWPGPCPDPADFAPAMAGFHAGYGAPAAAPAVCAFFQKFAALNAWAKLGTQPASGPARRRRLACLIALAETGQALLHP
ncbi:phosphotransferase family protein [Phaeovulum sp.]|uniref:phosphotransferase family protein n=1 Tax=Phaeovulum sp. TaxID=2934796 RepID=UPI0039E47464